MHPCRSLSNQSPRTTYAFSLSRGRADAIHTESLYAYAVALLHARSDGTTQRAPAGSGLAFTLGGGNQLVCQAIELLAEPLVGREIEELMAGWGVVFRQWRPSRAALARAA